MQNLVVVKADLENNVLLIKGNVPGANKSFLIVKSAVKKQTK
ncbi:MAG: 50S ribosomal protein L3, partial [Candidatus Izemoplasmatales bacterium]|nr:50S ribosomal protein L3 [Candidatus Izemoplasmatales bacterium]